MAKWQFSFLILCASAAICQTEMRPFIASASTGGKSDTDQKIENLQLKVKTAPGDYAGYDELGAAFFQKARETGDISYFDLAEQTLKKSIELMPRDFRAADPLVHIALVYMGEHRFKDALAYAQEAIGLGSGNLPAFAIEGDAYTDMGEYEAAAQAYGTVQTLGQATSSPLSLAYMSNSRIAYLRFLHGDSADAIQMMQSAIAAGLQINVPRENLAWLYFEVGERYFQAGNLDGAELAYQSGMAADANHYRCIAGLAKVRAAEGKFDESIRLYERSITIIPFPAYVEELGDVYRKVGKEKEAQQQYDLVEYIGHLGELNRVLTNRELALFHADQGVKLAEALRLAQNELEVRHDIYTWDTLAWVLYKNGQLQEAAEDMNKALALNTNDPLLLFHAGMIYHALERNHDAEEFLNRALKTNPQFHPFHADEARGALEDIEARKRDSRTTNAKR